MLKRKLTFEPCLGFPNPKLSYHLFVDAATGSADNSIKGGLGAALVQFQGGKPRAVGYASRSLREHEVNYTPYLAELAAAVFGIEHFAHHLIGRKFVLYTDHKPMEKLTCRQTKTLNRLQELMGKFDFEMRHVDGKGNVLADFASRNLNWRSRDDQINEVTINRLDSLQAVVAGLVASPDPKTWIRLQTGDTEIRNAREWIREKKGVPPNGMCKRFMSNLVIIDEVLVYKEIDDVGRLKHLIVTPYDYRRKIFSQAHGDEFSGHQGVEKTVSRIKTNYWWFGIYSDVGKWISECNICQRTARPRGPNRELQPLEQEWEPNRRVHVDLFGPLITDEGEKYILVMTDAFSKFTQLAPIRNKSAEVVRDAFVAHWVCRYGAPHVVVTDAGKEFKNKLWTEKMRGLGIEHRASTGFHPQTNGQVEIVNKTIAKYLKSFCDQETLQWVEKLPSLSLMINTSVHSSTGVTPHELMFTFPARTPGFDRRANERGSQTEEDFETVREMVIRNNEKIRTEYKGRFDDKVRPLMLVEGMRVLLHEPAKTNVGFGRKMIQPFTGPFIVRRIVGPKVVDISREPNGKVKRVNIERIKPFIGASDWESEAGNDEPPPVDDELDDSNGEHPGDDDRDTGFFDDAYVLVTPSDNYDDIMEDSNFDTDRYSQQNISNLPLSLHPNQPPQTRVAEEGDAGGRGAQAEGGLGGNFRGSPNQLQGNEDLTTSDVEEDNEESNNNQHLGDQQTSTGARTRKDHRPPSNPINRYDLRTSKNQPKETYGGAYGGAKNHPARRGTQISNDEERRGPRRKSPTSNDSRREDPAGGTRSNDMQKRGPGRTAQISIDKGRGGPAKSTRSNDTQKGDPGRTAQISNDRGRGGPAERTRSSDTQKGGPGRTAPRSDDKEKGCPAKRTIPSGLVKQQMGKRQGGQIATTRGRVESNKGGVPGTEEETGKTSRTTRSRATKAEIATAPLRILRSATKAFRRKI